ncbi:MAG: hypothetical protein QME40_02665 [bacterium]|nr:hypothetical protein [bacterium]
MKRILILSFLMVLFTMPSFCAEVYNQTPDSGDEWTINEAKEFRGKVIPNDKTTAPPEGGAHARVYFEVGESPGDPTEDSPYIQLRVKNPKKIWQAPIFTYGFLGEQGLNVSFSNQSVGNMHSNGNAVVTGTNVYGDITACGRVNCGAGNPGNKYKRIDGADRVIIIPPFDDPKDPKQYAGIPKPPRYVVGHHKPELPLSPESPADIPRPTYDTALSDYDDASDFPGYNFYRMSKNGDVPGKFGGGSPDGLIYFEGGHAFIQGPIVLEKDVLYFKDVDYVMFKKAGKWNKDGFTVGAVGEGAIISEGSISAREAVAIKIDPPHRKAGLFSKDGIEFDGGEGTVLDTIGYTNGNISVGVGGCGLCKIRGEWRTASPSGSKDLDIKPNKQAIIDVDALLVNENGNVSFRNCYASRVLKIRGKIYSSGTVYLSFGNCGSNAPIRTHMDADVNAQGDICIYVDSSNTHVIIRGDLIAGGDISMGRGTSGGKISFLRCKMHAGGCIVTRQGSYNIVEIPVLWADMRAGSYIGGAYPDNDFRLVGGKTVIMGKMHAKEGIGICIDGPDVEFRGTKLRSGTYMLFINGTSKGSLTFRDVSIHSGDHSRGLTIGTGAGDRYGMSIPLISGEIRSGSKIEIKPEASNRFCKIKANIYSGGDATIHLDGQSVLLKGGIWSKGEINVKRGTSGGRFEMNQGRLYSEGKVSLENVDLGYLRGEIRSNSSIQVKSGSYIFEGTIHGKEDVSIVSSNGTYLGEAISQKGSIACTGFKDVVQEKYFTGWSTKDDLLITKSKSKHLYIYWARLHSNRGMKIDEDTYVGWEPKNPPEVPEDRERIAYLEAKDWMEPKPDSLNKSSLAIIDDNHVEIPYPDIDQDNSGTQIVREKEIELESDGGYLEEPDPLLSDYKAFVSDRIDKMINYAEDGMDITYPTDLSDYEEMARELGEKRGGSFGNGDTISGYYSGTINIKEGEKVKIEGIVYSKANIHIKKRAEIVGIGALVAKNKIVISEDVKLDNFLGFPVALFTKGKGGHLKFDLDPYTDIKINGPIHCGGCFSVKDGRYLTLDGDLRCDDMGIGKKEPIAELIARGIIYVRDDKIEITSERIELTGSYLIAKNGINISFTSQIADKRQIITGDMYTRGNINFDIESEKRVDLEVSGNIYSKGYIYFRNKEMDCDIKGSIYSGDYISAENIGNFRFTGPYMRGDKYINIIGSGDLKIDGTYIYVHKDYCYLKKEGLHKLKNVKIVCRGKIELSDWKDSTNRDISHYKNCSMHSHYRGDNAIYFCGDGSDGDLDFSGELITNGIVRIKPFDNKIEMNKAFIHAGGDVIFGETKGDKPNRTVFNGVVRSMKNIAFYGEYDYSEIPNKAGTEIREGSILFANSFDSSHIGSSIIKGGLYATDYIYLHGVGNRFYNGPYKANTKEDLCECPNNKFIWCYVISKYIHLVDMENIRGYGGEGEYEGHDVFTDWMPPLDEWNGRWRTCVYIDGEGWQWAEEDTNPQPPIPGIMDFRIKPGRPIKCFSGAEYDPVTREYKIVERDGSYYTKYEAEDPMYTPNIDTSINYANVKNPEGMCVQELNHDLGGAEYQDNIRRDADGFFIFDGWIDFDGRNDVPPLLRLRSSYHTIPSGKVWLEYEVERERSIRRGELQFNDKDTEDERGEAGTNEALCRFTYWRKESKMEGGRVHFIGIDPLNDPHFNFRDEERTVFDQTDGIRLHRGDTFRYRYRIHDDNLGIDFWVGRNGLTKVQEDVEWFEFEIRDDDAMQPDFVDLPLNFIVNSDSPEDRDITFNIDPHGNNFRNQPARGARAFADGDDIRNNRYYQGFVNISTNFTFNSNAQNTIRVVVMDEDTHDTPDDDVEWRCRDCRTTGIGRPPRRCPNCGGQNIQIDGIKCVRLYLSWRPFCDDVENPNHILFNPLAPGNILPVPSPFVNLVVPVDPGGEARFNIPATVFAGHDGERVYGMITVEDSDNEPGLAAPNLARSLLFHGTVAHGRIILIRSTATVEQGGRIYRKVIEARAEVDQDGRIKRIISWDVK